MLQFGPSFECHSTVVDKEAVEFATLEWVDWFNQRRLLTPIGHMPPAECEQQYYQAQETLAMVAGVKTPIFRTMDASSSMSGEVRAHASWIFITSQTTRLPASYSMRSEKMNYRPTRLRQRRSSGTLSRTSSCGPARR